MSMISNSGKSEFLIQMQKSSIKAICIGFAIYLFFCCKMICKEIAFLEQTNNLSLCSEAKFSPIVNAMLLMLLLSSNTFFTFWGFYAMKYDEKERCLELRTLTFDNKSIIRYRYVWAILLLLSAVFISVIIALILHAYVFFKMDIKIIADVTPYACVLFVFKLFCIVLMAIVSLSVGMVLSLLMKNAIWGTVTCFIFDQVVVAKSWLMTGFVNRIFRDSKCFITVGECVWEEVPIQWVFFVAVAVCYGLYSCVLWIIKHRGNAIEKRI